MTDAVSPEVPIKEHPGGDDSLVVNVAVETVVLSVVLAQFGRSKYCGEWGKNNNSMRFSKKRLAFHSNVVFRDSAKNPLHFLISHTLTLF